MKNQSVDSSLLLRIQVEIENFWYIYHISYKMSTIFYRSIVAALKYLLEKWSCCTMNWVYYWLNMKRHSFSNILWLVWCMHSSRYTAMFYFHSPQYIFKGAENSFFVHHQLSDRNRRIIIHSSPSRIFCDGLFINLFENTSLKLFDWLKVRFWNNLHAKGKRRIDYSFIFRSKSKYWFIRVIASLKSNFLCLGGAALFSSSNDGKTNRTYQSKIEFIN